MLQSARKIKSEKTLEFVENLFEQDIHAKRVLSLSNATLGIISSGSLAIHKIGLALAQTKGLTTKHAIKQVDRLISNSNFNVWEYFHYWVPYVVGERREILLAMDWTEFEKDNQSTIMISLATSHGRAMPLIWKTVKQSELKNKRNDYEDEVLERLKMLLPEDTKVTILADRGFGDHKLYAFLTELGFDYVIRFRGNISVESEDGEVRTASQWSGQRGHAKLLRNAKVTGEKYLVSAVVCKHAKGMKEAWCLVCSDPDIKSAIAVNYYSKRWTIEPMFRDQKDHHYGMGMYSVRIKDPIRRDRLFFLSAIATFLLTLLGAAGEALGFDRMLKANTVKHRVHSLLRQGIMWYDSIPNMPEERFKQLINKFEELLEQKESFRDILYVV